MWTSVPQMPVRSTRIRTSLMPILGSGTSSSQRPVSDFLFTRAFISRARTINHYFHYTRNISTIWDNPTPPGFGVRQPYAAFCNHSSGANRFSQQFNTFRHGDICIFFALEFERDVTSVAGVRKNFCDAIVIEVEG